MLGSCVLLYSRLSLRFSLMRSKMAWLIGDLGHYSSSIGVGGMSTLFYMMAPLTLFDEAP